MKVELIVIIDTLDDFQLVELAALKRDLGVTAMQSRISRQLESVSAYVETELPSDARAEIERDAYRARSR